MFINIIIIIIFILSIVYTIKYKFMQINTINRGINALKKNNAYQTFLVSLGSHIGTGNIIGVSTALILGGSGTIFWMWVFTFTTSIFSLLENTLSIKSRIYEDNQYRSGASFYIGKYLGFNKIGLLFSIILILCNSVLFQPIQINTISETIKLNGNINNIFIFLSLTIICFTIIFKGTKMIVKFQEMVVPIMLLSYLLISIVVIITNVGTIPNVLYDIINRGINIKDFGLASFIFVATLGMKRSFFSNEAGLGTIPSISGMSEVKDPLDQAYVQVFGAWIDTFFCTLTALMILIYNVEINSSTSCDLVINVFITIFGGFGKYIGSFFLLSFAIATVASQFYSGESNLIYLIKKYNLNKKIIINIFKLLFIIGVGLGIYSSTMFLFEIIDYTLIILGIINILSLILIDRKVKNIVTFTDDSFLLKDKEGDYAKTIR